MTPPLSLQRAIAQRLRPHFSAASNCTYSSVGGGSINKAYRIECGKSRFFCKVNSASKFPQLFKKEKAGLQCLAQAGVIKTPAVINCFEAGGQQFLLLEWIEPGSRTDAFWKTFGQQLAALHCVHAGSFGLPEDNYMGSVPQQNRLHSTWTSFFASERLQPMLERCAQKGQLAKTHWQQLNRLTSQLPELFDNEPPSLLHGDLWSGNFLCSAASEAVLIDPAVYYGHPSADLGMTTLFGGFNPAFYQAYHYHHPLPANYREQWAVCNLYPLLIHLHLFGSSYLPQIEQTLRQF